MRRLISLLILLLCFPCLIHAEGLLTAIPVPNDLYDPFFYAATAEDQADPNTFILSFVGDCTVGEQYSMRGYRSGYTYKITQAGLDYPFSLVADMFSVDDLTLANCEVCFTAGLAPTKQVMALNAPARFAQVFALGNVDAVNVFNNHSLDFGPRGKPQTKEALDQFGIGHFDRNEPYITTIKGVKIGIISLCSAVRKDQLRQLRQLIPRLREEEGCSFLILSVHWGREDGYEIYGDQLKAEEWLDLGIDMIYGHGSHTLQPIRYYNDKLIFYSTSNFTFGANSMPKDMYTAVFQVRFHINEDKSLTVQSLNAIPFWQNENRDFRPYPIIEEEQRVTCWGKLYAHGFRRDRLVSNLPESFLRTGYVNFDTWRRELYPELYAVEATMTDLALPATATDLAD